MITTRMRPIIPDGPYPQLRLWPHVGTTPIRIRMRIMIRIVLKVIAFPPDSWTLNFTAWLRFQNQKRNDLHRFVETVTFFSDAILLK